MRISENIDNKIPLKSVKRVMVKTGLFLEIPVVGKAQIRPRRRLENNKEFFIPCLPVKIDSYY
jgi:dUTP pyrophosphatase